MGNCRGDPGAGKELGRAGDQWSLTIDIAVWEENMKSKSVQLFFYRSYGCPWPHLIALARKLNADCPLKITLIRLDLNGCWYHLNTGQKPGADCISVDGF